MKHPDQPENQAGSCKFGLSGARSGFGVSRIAVEYDILKCWEAWELFKVFDSKTEIENSDEEVEYGMTTGVDLDGPGTAGVMCHSLYLVAYIAGLGLNVLAHEVSSDGAESSGKLEQWGR